MGHRLACEANRIGAGSLTGRLYRVSWYPGLIEESREDERVLIYLAYVHGMKPSEISSQHHRLFPTVDDVYRIKRNVLERLRRNRRLQMMFKHQYP